DTGFTAAGARPYQRADVDPRHRDQGTAGVRAGAALCFAENSVVKSAPGESGSARAAGDFPVPEEGPHDSLPGPTGGCLYRAKIARPPDPTSCRFRCDE